jgi:hypothetical protein
VITGERLQMLADVSLVSDATLAFQGGIDRHAADMVRFADDPGELDATAIARLEAARSLFVYTHDVDAFIERAWPRMTAGGQVLITHNSDHEVADRHGRWLDGDGARLGRWFAQNATIAHPRLEPLPIGVSNTMWPHGNLRMLARAMRRQANRRRSELIFLEFKAITHPSRAVAAQALAENFPGGRIDPDPSLPWPRYLERLGNHVFSACPRGNGIDTHRVWESLYLGVFPVVERSALTDHWHALGLPLVLIDDWAEVTPARLAAERDRLGAAAPGAAPLRLSWHAARIAAALG